MLFIGLQADWASWAKMSREKPDKVLGTKLPSVKIMETPYELSMCLTVSLECVWCNIRSKFSGCQADALRSLIRPTDRIMLIIPVQ